ncbi:DUF2288 domain-containing protein [Verrucomicrobiales bacterium]|nr:DUF2288 domain-containing protein [Verrucomicrobiales bacterium]
MSTESNNPPEHMHYQMIGEDISTIAEKLAKYAGKASWDDLKAHLDSGSLIYVDESLDLTETAQAFADDDQARVADWLKSGDLVKPSVPHGAYWESIKASFECRIVSPFILIQPATD